MKTREKLVFAVLIFGIIFFRYSVAQEGGKEGEESSPALCQPCSQSKTSIVCHGLDQCPRYFHVSEEERACQMPAATAGDGEGVTSVTSSYMTTEDRNSTGNASATAEITTFTYTTPQHTTQQTTDPNNINITTHENSSNTHNATANSTPHPTTLTHDVTCTTCLENCRTCNGSDANDCLECQKDHEFDKQKKKCDLKKKSDGSGVGVAIIAGASAGGGVVLLVVVVVVVCVCCRRGCCRCCCGGRRRDEELGPGMLMNLGGDTVGGVAASSTSLSKTSSVEKGDDATNKGAVEEVQRRTSKPGMEAPEYANMTSTLPRPVSIERAHDKVTRYVRDPTIKISDPVTTEEQELANLPAAPLPPPGARKRSTDTGRPEPAPLPSSLSHKTPDTDRWRSPDHSKASTLPASSFPALPTSALAASSSSLPGSSHTAAHTPGSDSSQVPKFPMEEELEKQRLTTTGKRGKAAATAPEKASRVPTTPLPGEDLEEPEKDYENLESTTNLREAAEKRIGGVCNPGMVMDEGPEEEYINQAAIAGAFAADDENPYQNWPQPEMP